MGMDSGWFATFLEAFFESVACIALPIWRAFSVEPDGTRIAVTDESGWELAWSQCSNLCDLYPTKRYDCDHSIAHGRLGFRV
jgi:hypothetical protein